MIIYPSPSPSIPLFIGISGETSFPRAVHHTCFRALCSFNVMFVIGSQNCLNYCKLSPQI